MFKFAAAALNFLVAKFAVFTAVGGPRLFLSLVRCGRPLCKVDCLGCICNMFVEMFVCFVF